MQIPFRTRHDHFAVAPPLGSREIIEYMEQIDKYGLPELVEVGRYDMQERIEMYADQCDMTKIIKRYTETGDISILNKVQGTFGDFTNMPTSLAEMHNAVLRAEQLFNKLPKEIKDQYENYLDFGNALFSGAIKFDSVNNKLDKVEKIEKTEEIKDGNIKQ